MIVLRDYFELSGPQKTSPGPGNVMSLPPASVGSVYAGPSGLVTKISVLVTKLFKKMKMTRPTSRGSSCVLNIEMKNS